MAAGEPKQSLVGVFLQESFGSFLLLQFLFPFGALFGDTWAGWIQHFFCVMLCDWINGGAQVNPAVSVAATFYGWNTPTKTVVAIVGQVIGGTLAFPVAAELLPAYVQMGGPTLGGLDVQEGMMWECGLTFLLMLLILVAATQFGLPAQRPIIAAGIRALIYYGGKTGPAMNPMIAFAWAYFAAPSSLNMDHFLVYWAAPIVGAVAGVIVWKSVPKKVKRA